MQRPPGNFGSAMPPPPSQGGPQFISTAGQQGQNFNQQPQQNSNVYNTQPPQNNDYNAQPQSSSAYNSQPPQNNAYNAPPVGQTFNAQPPPGGLQSYNSQPPPSNAYNSQPPPGGQSFNSQQPSSSNSYNSQPPQNNMPTAPVSNQPRVPFFSTANGSPTPVPVSTSGPPMSGGPPSSMGVGPSSSMSGGPPSSMGGQPSSMGGQPSSMSGGPPSSMGGVPPSSHGSFSAMPPPPSNGGFQDNMPPPQSQQGGGPQFFSNPGMQSSNLGMQHGSGEFGSQGNMQQYNASPSSIQGGIQSQNSFGQDLNAQQQNAPDLSSQLPFLDNIDPSIQCNPAFLRPSVGKLINSQSMAAASRVPLGIICKPMAGDKGNENDQIEVVDFGTTGIVRCKKCRTYINPFVSWMDNGRKWRCNLCGGVNDVPNTYFSHLDADGQRRDKDQRPELSRCSVEFVAPGEYMVRPPQPPVYFFLIDVSSSSAASGMLQSCVNAIKASLDEIPGSPRTQIGFITYDTTIHFYNLKSTLAAPQMHVVSDVTDIILPLPEDLLVNLQDSRVVIDNLLDSIPSMFSNNQAVNSCTGPALSAAKAVIGHIGGKLCLFQSSLPTIGEGTLKPRDNPRLLGTDKEHTLLNSEESWYKNTAIECSKIQIAIDTFLFSAQYTDVATLSVLSKYTGGSTYYYAGFYSPRDGVKFERELHHCLTRATAFESVIRVRATRGVRISNFYGNYFVRGTDLLALPNCTSDSTFAFDLAYDESMLSAQAITLQCALLYTTTEGERRIRVHTMLIPITQNIKEMVDSIDIDCVVNLLSKQAIDVAQKTGFENARQRVNQIAIDMIRASKGGITNGQGGMPGQAGGYYPQQQQQAQSDAPIPESLQLLPLYSMALQKSLVLRGGNDVRIDERAYFHQLVQNMDIDESKVFIYPRMFSIHDMTEDSGINSDNADDDDCLTAGPFRVRLPALLNLTSERLATDGIFLLENGYELFMWIGRSVNPAIIDTLFGTSTLEGVDMATLAILADNSDFSSRVNAIVVALRQDRFRYMHLHFIKEGDGYAEAFFSRYLVEDRANFQGGAMSYTEFYTNITRQAQQGGGHPF
jgi:protein transport protein SEC24